MKSKRKSSSEYAAFESLLRQVIQVPRSELQRREDEYQEQKKIEKRPKTSDASRVSGDKD
jgi:hypothetical protein